MKDTVHSESRNLNLKLSSCLFAMICFLWLCNMQSLGSSYPHTFHINFLHNLTWQRAFFGKLSTNFA